MTQLNSLIPIGEKFLVKRKEREAITASGIIIPDIAQELPVEAHLVKVGTGKPDSDREWCFPDEIGEGDLLFLHRYGGTDLGGDYCIVPANSVLGVILPVSTEYTVDGKIFPVGHQVLVRMDDRITVTEGGILIPDRNITSSTWGTIIKKGFAVRNELEVNSRVFISSVQGTIYRERGIDYVLIHDRKITVMEEAA